MDLRAGEWQGGGGRCVIDKFELRRRAVRISRLVPPGWRDAALLAQVPLYGFTYRS